MKERSIILRAHEVRGVIAGTRTQLRRPLKSQPAYPDEYPPLPCQLESWAKDCPYWPAGRQLWVRETWATLDQDYRVVYPKGWDLEGGHGLIPSYRADHVDPRGDGPANPMDWRSSTQMPRWASRLTLEVVSVRVERLQSITPADALAEGVDPYEQPNGPAHPNAIAAFAELWGAHNKKHHWSANPFVWRLEFRRVTP